MQDHEIEELRKLLSEIEGDEERAEKAKWRGLARKP